MTLARFLNEPHPANPSYKAAFLSALATGVFISFFMLAFQPFGLNAIRGPHKLLIIAGYGLPSLVTTLATGLLLAFIFSHTNLGERWKVWHTLLVLLVFILIIGASNFLYDGLIFEDAFSLRSFLWMEYYTLLVGIFPSVVAFVSSRALLVMRNQAAAASLNTSIEKTTHSVSEPSLVIPAKHAETVTFYGENRDESLTTELEKLCYVKAEGNYAEIVLSKETGGHEARLLRTTLKDLQVQLAGHGGQIIRCHRSYLVNKSRIAKAEGNALGMQLSLDRDNLQVPVSRSYVSIFRD